MSSLLEEKISRLLSHTLVTALIYSIPNAIGKRLAWISLQDFLNQKDLR